MKHDIQWRDIPENIDSMELDTEPHEAYRTIYSYLVGTDLSTGTDYYADMMSVVNTRTGLPKPWSYNMDSGYAYEASRERYEPIPRELVKQLEAMASDAVMEDYRKEHTPPRRQIGHDV